MNADQAILRLLKQHVIAEQADLLAQLEQEGVHLTQSTLSRRFRRLSVVKLDGRYQHVEPPRSSPPPFYVDTAPPNLLVARLGPGLAQAMAIRLDQSDLEGLVGTIAGDDTILIIVKPPERLLETQALVEDFISRNG
jgi:transcriptional regulator of arginine metabolism